MSKPCAVAFIAIFVALCLVLGMTGFVGTAHAKSDIWLPPTSAHSLVPGIDLPGSKVHAVTYDELGFLWIGTDAGLLRWDGAHTLHITVDSTEGDLPRNSITDLAPAAGGGVWAAAGGLVRANSDGSIEETVAHAEKIEVVKSYVWTWEPERVQRYDSELADVDFEVDIEPGDMDVELNTTESGKLLIGTSTGLITLGKDRQLETYAIPGGVLGLARSDDGGAWLVSSSALWRLDDNTTRPQQVKSFAGGAEAAGGIAEIAPGQVAIGTRNRGVLIFNSQTNPPTIAPWQPTEDLAEPLVGAVTDISVQPGVSVTVVTTGSGIRQIAIGQVAAWSYVPLGLERAVLNVSDVTVDETGSLWMGTNDAGLIRLEPGHWEFAERVGGSVFDNKAITSVVTSGSRIWVATDAAGVYSVDIETLEVRDERHASQSDHINELTVDSEGQVWVTDEGFGVMRLDYAGRIEQFYGADQRKNWIVDSIVASSSYVWIGGRNGLERIDPATGSVTSWDGNGDLFGGVTISAIEPIDDRHLWLGNDRGLWYFDTVTGNGEHIELWPAIDVPVLQLGPIANSNLLWVGTNEGLLIVDAEAKAVVAHYGTWSGLATDNFIGVRGCTMPDGQSVLPTPNGLVIIDPTAIGTSAQPPKITTVLADDTTAMNRGKSYEFDHGTQELTFEFSDFNPVGIDAAVLDYRLAGYDKEWLRADRSEMSATYAHLPPGNYEFEVRSTSVGNPVAKIAETSVGIRMLSPWWTDVRLIAAAIATMFGGLLLIMRLRVHAARRRADDLRAEVEQRTRELADAKLAAEEANASKSRLMSSVSHDLRTPLTSVLGFTSLLQMPNVGNDQRERWANSANNAAIHLTHLVDELSEMASFDGRELQLNVEEVRLTEMIEAVAELCPVRTDLDVFCDSKLAPVYRTDPARLKRVLVNLVGNAIKHGTPPVELSIERVCDTTSRSDGQNPVTDRQRKGTDLSVGRTHRVRFAVVDYGAGIDDVTMERLFEPFTRGRSSSGDGFGLGLTISRRIVERLGGEICVDSQPGHTEFSFEIDLPVAGDPLRSGEWRPLVVEDDPAVRQLFQDEFAVLGIRGYVVATGAEASEIFDGHDINCLLTDHRLEGELGSDIAATLRAHSGGRELAVIAVTGNAEEARQYKVYDQVIEKPIRIPQLVAIAEASSRRTIHIDLSPEGDSPSCPTSTKPPVASDPAVDVAAAP